MENAKTYYKCTITPVPKEIERVLENVKLENGFRCKSEDGSIEKGGRVTEEFKSIYEK